MPGQLKTTRMAKMAPAAVDRSAAATSNVAPRKSTSERSDGKYEESQRNGSRGDAAKEGPEKIRH